MEDKVFKVSEFNEFINIYLGSVGEVVVEGEISQINLSQGRWVFATIKDENSSVEIFSVLDNITNFDLLEEGMLVQVYGTPRLYSKTGRFSISAFQIVPSGEGALKIAFEKLKNKLENEGLFDISRKRELPKFPQNIGLITAKNSQAYHDFIKILKARMGGIKIYFYSVQVQGKNSEKTIIQAINYFNNSKLNLDLIVITRGGGSLEDLQSFNAEKVARAVFSSKFPVVSGVGHEKDITITDLVADLRASTPSNAAELIVERRDKILEEVENNVSLLHQNLKYLLTTKLNFINQSISIMEFSFAKKAQEIQNITNRFKMQFDVFVERLKKQRDKILSLERIIKNLDYRNILKKGYSITYSSKNKIVRNSKDVTSGEIITTALFDGKIESAVK